MIMRDVQIVVIWAVTGVARHRSGGVRDWTAARRWPAGNPAPLCRAVPHIRR
jgi:hypothetical protein